jgi:VanZ family protein
MKNPGWFRLILRWGPALVLMAIIFLLSASPSDEMVNFGSYDFLFKKGAHMVGYGMLALAFLRGLGYQRKNHIIIVLLLVFLYAASDELHQSFVPGRNASSVDVLIDVVGAALALLVSRVNGVQRIVFLGLNNIGAN